MKQNSVSRISCSTHVCLAQLDKHQTSKLVMVCCEFNSHWRQLYFLLKLLKHLDVNFVQKCQICVIYENLDCALAATEQNIVAFFNEWFVHHLFEFSLNSEISVTKEIL